MRRGFLSVVTRFLLWDYPRVSPQYDVLVGLILIFILLAPRDWFHDRPRIPQASNIVTLPAEHGANVFWIEQELLAEVPEAERHQKVSEMLKRRTDKKQNLVRLEPVFDSEDEIKGYMAFTKP